MNSNKMNRSRVVVLAIICLMGIQVAYAGNPDRIGTAGAYQLTLNPWSRSSGWFNAGMAGVNGVDAMSLNPAGMVGMNRSSQFQFSRASYLGDVGIDINSLGFVQKIGASKSDALALTISSFDFGEITRTTVGLPDGGAGTYSIQMINLALGYSHKFSDNINAGFLVRFVSEGVADAKAQGAALDAGIQYKAGRADRSKFGVALRNIGPSITYGGDAFTVRAERQDADYSQTILLRTSDAELPSQLGISASYDILVADSGSDHRVTVAGSFISNAFDNDQFIGGLEYSFREILTIRGGYLYENDINPENGGLRTAMAGPAFGASFELPFGKERNRSFGIDYSYRTDPFGGTHTMGARLGL